MTTQQKQDAIDALDDLCTDLHAEANALGSGGTALAARLHGYADRAVVVAWDIRATCPDCSDPTNPDPR